jgi:hypothetical protein
MMRYMMALLFSLFYAAITLAATHNMAAAAAVAVVAFLIMLFILCLLKMAHQGDETV